MALYLTVFLELSAWEMEVLMVAMEWETGHSLNAESTWQM